ncbi:hypothetical protein CEXT_19231 [Caerostris extrusa]|uniref:Uncharacterized protein n=1 Tax=Caerostris extrusa TaxID=172846 RepID=A0AAV4XCB5_CAEEX|nr:hypothetical protein CEXT_19231 [Caerostris extrusa]
MSLVCLRAECLPSIVSVESSQQHQCSTEREVQEVFHLDVYAVDTVAQSPKTSKAKLYLPLFSSNELLAAQMCQNCKIFQPSDKRHGVALCHALFLESAPCVSTCTTARPWVAKKIFVPKRKGT